MSKTKVLKKRKIVVATINNADKNVVQEQYVICEVCGQANKITNSLCSKCSNYLHD